MSLVLDGSRDLRPQRVTVKRVGQIQRAVQAAGAVGRPEQPEVRRGGDRKRGRAWLRVAERFAGAIAGLCLSVMRA